MENTNLNNRCEYLKLRNKVERLKTEYSILLDSNTTINFRTDKRNFGQNQRSVFKAEDYPLLNEICLNAIKLQIEVFENELSNFVVHDKYFL